MSYLASLNLFPYRIKRINKENPNKAGDTGVKGLAVSVSAVGFGKKPQITALEESWCRGDGYTRGQSWVLV